MMSTLASDRIKLKRESPDAETFVRSDDVADEAEDGRLGKDD